MKEKSKFITELVDDNLCRWRVALLPEIWAEESALRCQLMLWAKKWDREPHLVMEIVFPGDYPFSPPFVRVVRPRDAEWRMELISMF